MPFLVRVAGFWGVSEGSEKRQRERKKISIFSSIFRGKMRQKSSGIGIRQFKNLGGNKMWVNMFPRQLCKIIVVEDGKTNYFSQGIFFSHSSWSHCVFSAECYRVHSPGKWSVQRSMWLPNSAQNYSTQLHFVPDASFLVPFANLRFKSFPRP